MYMPPLECSVFSHSNALQQHRLIHNIDLADVQIPLARGNVLINKIDVFYCQCLSARFMSIVVAIGNRIT